VINPAKAFSNAYYNIQKGLASADRINEILALVNPVANAKDAVILDDFESSIVFENVSFRYPGTDVDVLTDLNITIGKGEIIALVGSSGSGKSTLADLIPRFHDPVQGRILIDGMDLRQVQVESLRDNMGIVTQEAILFNDTIDMNIRFSTDATQAQVEKAARYANAHDFIMETEEGYQTVVGERGTRLSGGQRRRITIARALVKNPPILILDEATAALDSESERLVQEALDHVMQGRTSVIIAHRLSTIRHADRIFVMKEGRIVETGTHEQLQRLDGEYRKFIELQAF
jgi:subfamily B ATP-binding cassette protein MsbA